MNQKSDLFLSEGVQQHLYCAECGDYLSLIFHEFNETIDNINIIVDNLPFLECGTCKATYLPDRSRLSLMRMFTEVEKKKSKGARTKRQKLNEKFALETEVEFNYDSDDYYYLPGLINQDYDGFFTPVFFSKSILIRFDNWQGYQVRFLARDYGLIEKIEEFSLHFGINCNDKVIMWLGDIGKFEEIEQQYLKSENINSDHNIGGQFYDSQIEGKYPDKIPHEQTLIAVRSDMLLHFRDKFNSDIGKLDDEAFEAIGQFRKPMAFSERDMNDVIDILNKICVESIQKEKPLRIVIECLGFDYEASHKDLNLFQFILEKLLPEQDAEKANLIMNPFLVLSDLRNAFSHNHAKDAKQAIIESCIERLGASLGNDEYEKIYEILVRSLITSYREIGNILIIN